MKKLLPLLLLPFVFSSCCIRHQTFAQSDRFDSHRPTFPVIECIPCAGLKNVNENFFWMEALGSSGSYSMGWEQGHNFNNMRLYGSAGVSYWPFRNPTVTLIGQFGIIPFNPDFTLHPDFGAGICEWMINGNKDGQYQLHPAMKQVKVGSGSYPSWQLYGGLRIKVPYSNVDLSFRIYRMETFKPQNNVAWYPGFVCAFRL